MTTAMKCTNCGHTWLDNGVDPRCSHCDSRDVVECDDETKGPHIKQITTKANIILTIMSEQSLSRNEELMILLEVEQKLNGLKLLYFHEIANSKVGVRVHIIHP